MKIATFNANSIRARLPIVQAWLSEHQPEILCLQETKVVDADFPGLAFTELGYHVASRGEKSYNGVAVLSRAKPTAVRFGFDDGGPTDETRFVHARFGSLHVINTYVPQGREIDHEMYQYKLKWFKRLKDYLARHMTARQRVVWVGDLNVAPEHKDIHNADKQLNHVCFHGDVRAAFADTMQWGFVDVFRSFHPEPGHYTFFDYRTPNAAKRKMGWRIDHILATPGLMRRATGAGIDLAPRLKPKPSDHTFLWAEFKL